MVFWKLFSLRVFQSWFLLFATSKIILCSRDIFVCLGSLILSFTCNFSAYFKFHSDWRRVIGKIKQNKLDCSDTAPLKFVLSFIVRLAFFPNPRTLQFHNKTKKHPNNTSTEIWQCVDDTQQFQSLWLGIKKTWFNTLSTNRSLSPCESDEQT